MHGVLPVDKPAGPTSHDIVGMARRALKTRRVGHTGTLDPFASGLLLLCVGQATRIAEYVTALPKRYRATIRFGQTTDTDDPIGRVIHESESWRDITRERLLEVIDTFCGDILQVPATFSAKKRDGVRAYQAAREGRAVDLEPVRVRVLALELLAFDPPFATIDVSCSSGTYVRALARDIGAALGSGAHLTALRRTGIGKHDVDDALSVDALADESKVGAAMIPTAAALEGMPRVVIDDDDVERIRHGRFLQNTQPAGTVALITGDELVAIAEADGRLIRPRKVFVA